MIKPEQLMATRSKYSQMMLPVKSARTPHMEERPAATDIMDRAHAGPTISRTYRPGDPTVRCPECGGMTCISHPSKRTMPGLGGQNIVLPAYCGNCGKSIQHPPNPHPNDSGLKGYARG